MGSAYVPQQKTPSGSQEENLSDCGSYAILSAMRVTSTNVIKLLLLILGFYALWSRLWACEDAYITFRYIENWVNGHGLVYNLGDKVEGFTHPLWLLLVALPTFLGANVRASALILSLLISLLALAVILWRDRSENNAPLVFPLAAVLLLSHTGYRDFSVSGLEFPLVVLLMAWFFISYKNHELLSKPYLHGSLLALLYLTRPELALMIPVFFAVYGGKALWTQLKVNGERAPQQWLGLAQLAAPIVGIAGAYHLFRWAYYGEFFPNTYYAKQGLGAYWSQGWIYFEHFWRYSLVLLLVVVIAAALLLLTKNLRRLYFTNLPRMVMLLQIIVLSIYVVRLGGDFMAYRFLLPPMLIGVILLNDLPDRFFHGRITRLSLAGGGLVAAVLLVIFPPGAEKRLGYIADERQYYDLYHPPYQALFEDPVDHVWYKMGRELRKLQEVTKYRIVHVAGNIGYMGYAAGPGVYILDVFGLVDRQTARAWDPLRERDRPGHEDKLTLDMAIDRGVTFCGTPFGEYERVLSTSFGSVITLDPKFLRHVPDKVEAFKELKRRCLAGEIHDGTCEFLHELENRYGVNVDNL